MSAPNVVPAPQEIQDLTVLCSWCRPDSPTRVIHQGVAGGAVSHGICEAHRSTLLGLKENSDAMGRAIEAAERFLGGNR